MRIAAEWGTPRDYWVSVARGALTRSLVEAGNSVAPAAGHMQHDGAKPATRQYLHVPAAVHLVHNDEATAGKAPTCRGNPFGCALTSSRQANTPSIGCVTSHRLSQGNQRSFPRCPVSSAKRRSSCVGLTGIRCRAAHPASDREPPAVPGVGLRPTCWPLCGREGSLPAAIGTR